MNNRIPKIPKMKIEDLLEKLKEEFRIGHWDPKEEEFTPRGAFNMHSIYRTLSPQKFETYKCGLNYDYTEYLAWYFTTYFNSTFFELYYIEFNDGFNYTFLIYQDQYGYHLVIPDGYLPVYGVIDKGTEDECVQFIVNVISSYRMCKPEWIVFKYLPTGIYGCTIKQFMDDKWVWRWYYKSSCREDQVQFLFKRVNTVL